MEDERRELSVRRAAGNAVAGQRARAARLRRVADAGKGPRHGHVVERHVRRDADDRRSAVIRKARDEERLAVLRKGEDDLDVAGAPLGVADHDLLHRQRIIIIEHKGREIPGLERLLGREPGHAPRALDVVSRRRVPRVVAGERRREDDLQRAVDDSAAHLDRHDKARAGRLDDELRRRLGRDDGGEAAAACWAFVLVPGDVRPLGRDDVEVSISVEVDGDE